MKRFIAWMLTLVLLVCMLAGCGVGEHGLHQHDHCRRNGL